MRNYFEFFGLEPKLCVDAGALQKRFYELSRQWHPDRFSRKSPAEQAEALEATSILNDGYRTLKDPVKRAEYLLKEEGLTIGGEPPPELLEEMFELNMALEEAKSGDGQLAAAKENFAALRATVDKELEDLFSKYDEAPSKQVLQELRGLLNRRRYINNLLRDVEL